MRNIYSALSLFCLCAVPPAIATAGSLNGNLDFSLENLGQEAKLVLKNKIPETPAVLKSVAILVPRDRDRSERKISIPIPLGQEKAISPDLTITLGAVSVLSSQVAPTKDLSKFAKVKISEDPACVNCTPQGFGLEVNVQYPNGVQQQNLTGAYLHYYPH